VGRLADLDAVTFDANGTLLGLVDPAPKLERLLRDRGFDRPLDAIRRALAAEGAVYAGRSVEAHEPGAFGALQRECTGVFLDEVGAGGLDSDDFTALYVGAMEFEVLPGVRDSLRRLQRRGLALGVIANFDLTLDERLREHGLAHVFATVVTPADAGAAKPDPRIFQVALERLGVAPKRALHIGDGVVDEEGARATGMNFAWAPIPQALESWV
jgi:HAD superfamily hydrolase (TIGR01509 family)